MEIDVRPGRYPGEWKIVTNVSGWSEAARQVHRGMERKRNDIFSSVISVSETLPPTRLSIFNDLNAAIESAEARYKAGHLFNFEPAESNTYGDALRLVLDFLNAAVKLVAAAEYDLADGDIEGAMSSYGVASEFHGMFIAMLHLLSTGTSDDDGIGAARAFASTGGRARARLFEDSKRKVVDLYRRHVSPKEKATKAAALVFKLDPTIGLEYDTIVKVIRLERKQDKK